MERVAASDTRIAAPTAAAGECAATECTTSHGWSTDTAGASGDVRAPSMLGSTIHIVRMPAGIARTV